MAARRKPAGQTQVERDAIALGRIESYMDCLIKGTFNCPSCGKETETKELSTTAVQLIRARYDKLRPSLSAVEQTTIDAPRTQDEIINDIKALLAANPALLETLLPGYRIIPAISQPICSVNDTDAAQQTVQ